MFGLLICLNAGIHPIITSSSDEKLEAICKLAPAGAISTINYRTHPDWDVETNRLTDGKGVDFVLETVGISTISKSLAALRDRGTVSLIGFLGGQDIEKVPNMFLPLLMKGATAQYVHFLTTCLF